MSIKARTQWPHAPHMAGISHHRGTIRSHRAQPPEWWVTPDDPYWAAQCVARHAIDGGEETALLEMLGIADG